MAASGDNISELELGDVLRAICRSNVLRPQSLEELLAKAKGNEPVMTTILNESIITHAYWCLPMVLEASESKPNFKTIALAYRSEEDEGRLIEVMEILMASALEEVEDCLEDISLVTHLTGGVLLSAASAGKTKLVNYLINLGCNPNVKQANIKYTPLHNAAGYGHPEIVNILLQSGAKVDEQNTQGLTPLMFAVQNGHCDIAKQILHVGCELNLKVEISEYTALHCAASVGCKACVRQLLNSGAEADSLDAMGCTSLVTAVVHEHSDIVRILLEEGGCNPDLQDENSGMTALHRAADIGNPWIVTLLLSYHAHSFIVDLDGATPLSLAVNSEHLEVIRLLLPLIGQVDSDGDLLVTSIQRGYWTIASLLFNYGASTAAYWKQNSTGWSTVTKRDPDKMMEILEVVSNPPALKHLVRIKIRNFLGHVVFGKVQKLRLPPTIMLYILFNDGNFT